MATINNQYQEFNNFQSAFYLDINLLNNYTNIEFKTHGYSLLHNIGKGYPALADLFFNLRGFGWKAIESPSLIKALQKQFVNGFNVPRIPYQVYFKSEPIEKTKVKETSKGLIFDKQIQFEICSIMKIDSKTYDTLKFSKRIQDLGMQIDGHFATKSKTTKKKK